MWHRQQMQIKITHLHPAGVWANGLRACEVSKPSSQMSSIKGPAPAPESFPGAEKLKIGIVHARWNKEVIDALVKGTLESLQKAGVRAEQVAIDTVPGSWELPMGTLKMIKRDNVDAVVSIGCVIKGSTMHFEYICDNSLKGLMRVSLDTKVPVILGVLTALDEDQALERAGIGRKKPGHNHGLEWGAAAVEYVYRTLTKQNGPQGAQARNVIALGFFERRMSDTMKRP